MVRSFLRNRGKHYGTSLSWERHVHVRRQSSNTAIIGIVRAAQSGTAHEHQGRREAAQARDCRGYEDRADGIAPDGFVRGRGGDGRGILAAHTPAASRLSLCRT